MAEKENEMWWLKDEITGSRWGFYSKEERDAARQRQLEVFDQYIPGGDLQDIVVYGISPETRKWLDENKTYTEERTPEKVEYITNIDSPQADEYFSDWDKQLSYVPNSATNWIDQQSGRASMNSDMTNAYREYSRPFGAIKAYRDMFEKPMWNGKWYANSPTHHTMDESFGLAGTILPSIGLPGFGQALGYYYDYQLANNFINSVQNGKPDLDALQFGFNRLRSGIPNRITPENAENFPLIDTNPITPIIKRYKFANTKLADPTEIEASVKNILKNKLKRDGKYYYHSGEQNDLNLDGTVTQHGTVYVSPGKTTEMHINPTRIVDVTLDGHGGATVDGIREILPEKSPNLTAGRVFKSFPQGTVVTNKSSAIIVPQVVPKLPLSKRLNYYLRGKLPHIKSTPPVQGFSTDIMDQFSILQNKNKGIITNSLNTELNGLNAYGKSWKDYSEYFGELTEDGNALYKSMSAEQVTRWNNEIAPKTGIYIDPFTRTSNHPVLITK